MDKSLENIILELPQSCVLINDDTITEIRVRVNHNLIINRSGIYSEMDNSLIRYDKLEKIFQKLCDYTISAYENQIERGYITLRGGHRIGIGANFKKTEEKIFFKNITSLNIRINRNCTFEYPEQLMDFRKGLLILGPPHSGKTTLLRTICCKNDLINHCIVVCDERNEIYSEKTNCDFISGLPKEIAIEYATRSLNPDIIICDEIGNTAEAVKILSCVNSGVRFICTAHSEDIPQAYKKPAIKMLLSSGVFDKFALLDASGYKVKEISDV